MGNKIRATRLRLGMSQGAFAKAIGLKNHSPISRYENGFVTPDDQVLEQIAILADKSVNWFRDDDLNEFNAAFSADLVKSGLLGGWAAGPWEQLCDRLLPLSQQDRMGFVEANGRETGRHFAAMLRVLARLYDADGAGVEDLVRRINAGDGDLEKRDLIRMVSRIEAGVALEDLVDHYQLVLELREVRKLLATVLEQRRGEA
jgi:transcriptional regulator with XRE-family HTH domain